MEEFSYLDRWPSLAEKLTFELKDIRVRRLFSVGWIEWVEWMDQMCRPRFF